MPEQQTGVPAIGERIRQARLSAGFSQESAAAALGKRQRWVSNVERAIQNVLADDLDALASLYGTSADRLLGREGVAENLLAKLGDVQRGLIAVPVYDMQCQGTIGERVIDYEYMKVPDRADSSLRGFRVRGECLHPDIHDGYVVIVDRDKVPAAYDPIVFIDDGIAHVGWLEIYQRSHAVRTGRTQPVESVEFIGTVVSVLWRPQTSPRTVVS